MEESVKLENCDPHMIIKSIEESIETLRSIETLEQLKKEEQLNNLEDQNHLYEDEDESSIINSSLASVFTCYHCGSNYATKGDIRQHLKDGYCSGVRCDLCWRHFPSRTSVHFHILRNCLKLVSPMSDSFATISATKMGRCSKCNESFLSKDLKKHWKEFHQKESECGVCHRIYKDKANFKRHLLNHSGVCPFECEFCKKKFKVLAELRKHEKRHNLQKREPKHTCDICGKEFPTSPMFLSHMVVHSDARPFSCDLCSSTFKRKNALHMHISTVHINERSFVCGICHKAFRQKLTLKNHLIVHTAEKPFKCHICLKRFRYRYSLEIHIASHKSLSKPEPFKCDTCCKSFKTRSILKTHQISHSDSRPFPCDVCGKSFKTKVYKDRHIAIVHSESRVFQCETCGFKFKTKQSLKSHVVSHSEVKPFECNVCRKRFGSQWYLKRHRLTHAGVKCY